MYLFTGNQTSNGSNSRNLQMRRSFHAKLPSFSSKLTEALFKLSRMNGKARSFSTTFYQIEFLHHLHYWTFPLFFVRFFAWFTNINFNDRRERESHLKSMGSDFASDGEESSKLRSFHSEVKKVPMMERTSFMPISPRGSRTWFLSFNRLKRVDHIDIANIGEADMETFFCATLDPASW